MNIYSNVRPYTYVIRFVPTGQVYYGMRSANRVPAHEDLWCHYFTTSKIVKRLIKEYGKENFLFEVRRVFNTHDEASSWEKKVLTRMKVLKNPKIWLNQSIAGTKFRFTKHTENSRKLIGKKHKGKIVSEKTKKKISESRKGKPSYFPNEEQKIANSLRQKGKSKKSGWKHSQTTKNKIGAKHRGKLVSKETRQKLSNAAKNRPTRVHSPETKEKIRKAITQYHREKSIWEDDYVNASKNPPREKRSIVDLPVC